MGEFSNPQFNVSATLIRRLADELFHDGSSALAELIKNAYDADARHVKIEVNTANSLNHTQLHYSSEEIGYVKVEDDGMGMSPEGVKNHWLNFSFSSKTRGENSPGNRAATGGQGMGRLSTYLLGKKIELFTCANPEQGFTHVAFDWSDFEEKKALTEIPLFIESIAGAKATGTTLIIHPLKNPSQWSREKIGELTTELWRKVGPFINKRYFQVELLIDGFKIELEKSQPASDGRNIHLINVWQKMSPELVKEVVDFWNTNKMLRPGQSADERAQQVVFLVRAKPENKVVGVATAMPIRFKQLNNKVFFYYRSIVLPEFRQPGLASKLIVETRDFLESISIEGRECIGLLTLVENPSILQAKREAIWPASKMIFMGVDKNGRHIRVYYFKGARI